VPVDIAVLPKEIVLNNITLNGPIIANGAIIRGKIAFTK